MIINIVNKCSIVGKNSTPPYTSYYLQNKVSLLIILNPEDFRHVFVKLLGNKNDQRSRKDKHKMKKSSIKNLKYYVTDQIKIRTHQEVFNRLLKLCKFSRVKNRGL